MFLRKRVKLFTALLLSSTCISAPAFAQSIPLQIIHFTEVNSSGQAVGYFDRIGIRVGINGGAPEEYLFDTGSSNFNVDVGTNTGGTAWYKQTATTPMNDLTADMYGNGSYGYLVDNQNVNNLQFYNGSNQQVSSFNNPAISVGAATYYIGTNSGLDGDEAGVVIANKELTADAKFDGQTGTFYQDKTWQDEISAGKPSFGGDFYGIFGAGDFGGSVPEMMTNSGFIVEANGSSSPIGSCGSACMIVGLNPSLRAQFNNFSDWNGVEDKAPISGANSAYEFASFFGFTLANQDGFTRGAIWMPTLLDTGTPFTYLAGALVYSQAIIQNLLQPNGNLVNGATVTVQGQPQTGRFGAIFGQNFTITADNTENDLTDEVNVVSAGTASYAVEGVPFFLHNSVMYDLQNKLIGYSPFFVTNDTFDASNGLAVSPDMGPVGFANTISGNGGYFLVDNNAQAYLTAKNTHNGYTLIAQNGWLGLGDPGNIQSSYGVLDSGIFDVSNTKSTTIQRLIGDGQVILGSSVLNIADGGVFNGSITTGYTDAEMKNTNVPYKMFSDPIASYTTGGLIVSGGTLVLNGTNTFYGPTGISPEATLINNGTLGSGVVSATNGLLNAGNLFNNGLINGMTTSTGLIAGDGTFGNGVYESGLTVNGGVVMPMSAGGQPGTINTGMNLIFNSGTYTVLLSGDKSSLLADLNTYTPAQINGGFVSISPSLGAQAPIIGKTYTVAEGNVGIKGRFAGVENVFYPFLKATLTYPNFYVNLTLTPNNQSVISYAANSNQHNVAAAIDGMSDNNSVKQTIETIPYNSISVKIAGVPVMSEISSYFTNTLPTALDTLDGNLNASVQSVLYGNNSSIGNAVAQRMDMSLGYSAVQSKSYDNGQVVAATNDKPVIWMDGQHGWTDYKTSNTYGINSNDTGSVIGLDIPVSGVHVGALFGFGSTTANAVNSNSDFRDDHETLGAYALDNIGNWAIDGGAAYTWNDIKSHRQILYYGFHNIARGQYSEDAYQIFNKVSYNKLYGKTLLSPFVSMAYIHEGAANFNENGGQAGLRVNAKSMSDVNPVIGMQASRQFTVGNVKMTPYVMVGYQHTIGNTSSSASEAFEGSQQFTVNGLEIARNSLLTSAAVKMKITKATAFAISYNGEFSSKSVSNGIEGNLSISF